MTSELSPEWQGRESNANTSQPQQAEGRANVRAYNGENKCAAFKECKEGPGGLSLLRVEEGRTGWGHMAS